MGGMHLSNYSDSHLLHGRYIDILQVYWRASFSRRLIFWKAHGVPKVTFILGFESDGDKDKLAPLAWHCEQCSPVRYPLTHPFTPNTWTDNLKQLGELLLLNTQKSVLVIQGTIIKGSGD